MFHHFHGSGHAVGQGSITAEEFDEMIEFIGPEQILSAQDWLNKAQRGVLDPGDICLTFDDSLRCQYDIAVPVLQARGLTAFWFVYSSVFEGNLEMLEIYRYYRSVEFENVDEFYKEFDIEIEDSEYNTIVKGGLEGFDCNEYLNEFPIYTASDRRFRFIRDRILGPTVYHEVMERMVERAGYDYEEFRSKLWMDDACLRQLQQLGHIVGLHSYHHPTDLAALSVVDQVEEYEKNHTHLEAALGNAPTTMSHPCNSYSAATLEILKSLGIKLGFRANMRAVSPRSHLEYPREDHANILKQMRS